MPQCKIILVTSVLWVFSAADAICQNEIWPLPRPKHSISSSSELNIDVPTLDQDDIHNIVRWDSVNNYRLVLELSGASIWNLTASIVLRGVQNMETWETIKQSSTYVSSVPVIFDDDTGCMEIDLPKVRNQNFPLHTFLKDLHQIRFQFEQDPYEVLIKELREKIKEKYVGENSTVDILLKLEGHGPNSRGDGEALDENGHVMWTWFFEQLVRI